MPAYALLFGPKRQSETCYLSPPFDFISALAVGETIVTQVVTCVVYSGIDANPSALISGQATVQNGTQVQQLITGGIDGVIYDLKCLITTSLGQTLELTGLLAVLV